MDERIREVLEWEDLTVRQKREIAETLSIPNVCEIEAETTVKIEK
jgi:hypothetical protein